MLILYVKQACLAHWAWVLGPPGTAPSPWDGFTPSPPGLVARTRLGPRGLVLPGHRSPGGMPGRRRPVWEALAGAGAAPGPPRPRDPLLTFFSLKMCRRPLPLVDTFFSAAGADLYLVLRRRAERRWISCLLCGDTAR